MNSSLQKLLFQLSRIYPSYGLFAHWKRKMNLSENSSQFCKIRISIQGKYHFLLYPILVLGAFFITGLSQWLLFEKNIFSVDLLIFMLLMTFATGLITNFIIGSHTIFLAKEGLWIDSLRIPWQKIDSIEFSGSGQAGIRIIIHFQFKN